MGARLWFEEVSSPCPSRGVPIVVSGHDRAAGTNTLTQVDLDVQVLRVGHNQLGSRTQPIVNTSMIGAFARILDMPPIDSVAEAIREEIVSGAEANIEAARDAFNEVQMVGMISETGK